MTQKLNIDFLKNRYIIFWGKNSKEIMILLVKLLFIINNKDFIYGMWNLFICLHFTADLLTSGSGSSLCTF